MDKKIESLLANQALFQGISPFELESLKRDVHRVEL